MSFIAQKNADMVQCVSRQLRRFLSLTDGSDAEMLERCCEHLETGIFDVLVLGKFINGKSTLLNALAGQYLFQTQAAACTSVIASIEYGNDSDLVKIIYTDKVPEKMSLEQFTERFRLSMADQYKIMEEGKLDRFMNVDHVEMYSQAEFFRNGVRLIDSPGLEIGYARTKATYNYVPKANAIIFTLSAISLFSAEEKSYIAEHFVGKYPRNVFFVVNRVDNLNEGQLDESIKPTVRAGLEAVFTDKNGHFDEALYNSRVFFTSAYPALCAKTDTPYKVMVGPREVEVPFPLEETGLPEFEAALKEFMNSDERIWESLFPTLTQMEKTIRSKEDLRQQLSDRIAERSKKIIQLRNAKALVPRIEQNCLALEKSLKESVERLFLSLCDYVRDTLPTKLKAPDLAAQCGLEAGWHLIRKEKRDQIVEACSSIVRTHLQDWQNRAYKEIESESRTLEDIIRKIDRDFDVIFSALNQKFFGISGLFVPIIKLNHYSYPYDWPSVSPVDACLKNAIESAAARMEFSLLELGVWGLFPDIALESFIRDVYRSFLQLLEARGSDIKADMLNRITDRYDEPIQKITTAVTAVNEAEVLLIKQIAAQEDARAADTNALLKVEAALVRMRQCLSTAKAAISGADSSDESIR